jgi:hypothetical protein
MAYLVSGPRRQFTRAMVDIVRRLKLAKKAVVSSDLREFTIAAAIFLAHAELENYFCDVLDGIARLYCASSPPGSKLPPRLRSHLFVERSNIISAIAKKLAGSDEQAFLGAVDGVFVGPAASILNDAVPFIAFSGQHILADHSYPSKKNLVRVLRRIGIGDPEGALKGALRMDVISQLESIASLRTGLAHSAALPGVSCDDVIQRIKGLEHFVRAMDLVLYTHTQKTHKAAAWRAAMT